MASNLILECADRSVRWYLTPGQASRYEILVTNQSGDERIDCTMVLDDPPNGGVFEPASFALRPRERKTVALTFHESTDVPRDQRALISVRDPEGIVIASLERGLISAGGTDCIINLSWKEPILDGGQVRGFVISCAIKSLSASPGNFALQPTPHPTLEFVDVAPVRLEPGQSATIAVPILWKRTVKDAQGNDHPHVIEIGVAVSQGRRTGRIQWETMEGKLAALASAAARPVAPMPMPAAAAPQVTTAQPPQAPPAPGAYPSAPSEPLQPQLLETEPVEQPQLFQVAPAQPPAEPPYATQPAASAQEPPAADSGDPKKAITPAPQTSTDPSGIDEDALMSLLVGKPVSPPSGWRGPGREAPDAPPSAPATIFAKTPPSVTAPPPATTRPPSMAPPPAPPPLAPPPLPAAPPAAATPPVAQPPARPADAPGIPPAARIIGPVTPPPKQPAAAGTGAEEVPQAWTRARAPEQPPGAANGAASNGASAMPSQSDFEGSIVGAPPSLQRTLEAKKEQLAAQRRTAEAPEVRSRMRDSQLPTVVLTGTALVAIAFAVFYYVRPAQQPQTAPPPAAPTATAVVQQTTAAVAPTQAAVQPQASGAPAVPPPVVLETVAPGLPRNPAKSPAPAARTAPSIAPSAAARVAAQATQRAITTTPAPRVATPRPIQVAQAPKPTPRPHPRARRPIPASPNRIVQMAGIDAHYGPAGRAIRVLWGASGQASAHVELFDDRGSVLSQTDVVGTRQNALLYVPPGYRGPVVVQVVSVGALGERVTQSTSLPAFAR